MQAGVLFWGLMILALIFGGLGVFDVWSHGLVWMNGLLWVLLALLGWKAYGPILHQ